MDRIWHLKSHAGCRSRKRGQSNCHAFGITSCASVLLTVKMTDMKKRWSKESEFHFLKNLSITCTYLELREAQKKVFFFYFRFHASGDLLLHDLGQGLGLRPGCADGAISISALQWLCNADKAFHKPAKRLATFFASLYAALARGARAVFQFYPENDSQVELITQQGKMAYPQL